MPFDDSTRSRLARFVTDARELIAAEFATQCQQIYGLAKTGEITPLDALRDLDEAQRSVAALLRERAEYLRSGSFGEKNPTAAALEQLVREQAFTVLNRLAAIRMAEKRELVLESVGRGYQSKGFQVYIQLVGNALGDAFQRYRRYLFCLFDELALDVGVLFDRRSPYGLLFPRENALLGFLKLLNAPDLDALWAEDETIGWIYQYYNDDAERKRMRKSTAPRNSRELAVRNQFFTPRYVVEFLTDNTLGRIWYEMTRGQTVLKERCRFLVIRSGEVFLDEEDKTFRAPLSGALTQEDLLKAPVYIPDRPIKDPRELRLLDPACGSMHFGLYAFDLLETIYEEAWELSCQGRLPPSPGKPLLHEEYPSKEAFLRDVPKLIVEQNIHGIDIDQRAVQIAVLSLRLRAQKRWSEQRLPLQDRPKIAHSNVVCAEPMPGNLEMQEQFTSGLKPVVLGQLMARIFAKMQLAGDAGSLLKIEEEIVTLVQEAKQQWEEGPRAEQTLLFPEAGPPVQAQFRFNQAGVSDEKFWQTAEQRIYDALQEYSEQGEHQYSRRLFAQDAVRGFAFIDQCRKKYDVIVMNPPFGDRPVRCDQLLQDSYDATAGDMYSMFFERSLRFLHERGRLGVISNRTWLGLPTFVGLRTTVLGKLGSVECAADLGSFVLEAQVETAAVVIGKGTEPDYPAIWVRLLKTKAKETTLHESIEMVRAGIRRRGVYLSPQTRFTAMPSSVFGYWMSDRLIAVYRAVNSIGARIAMVKQGTATADDPRFLRLAWEVPVADIGIGKQWLRFAKGGEYAPFYDDVHLVLNWRNDGEEIRAWGKGRPQNTKYFGRLGVTWPLRTTSPFSPRPLPSGCAFGHKGPAAFPKRSVSPSFLLGILASRPARLLLSVRLGAGDDAPGSASKSYEVGLIRELPCPDLTMQQELDLTVASDRCSTIALANFIENDETSALFLFPSVLTKRDHLVALEELAATAVSCREDRFVEFSQLTAQIDKLMTEGLGFSAEDIMVMNEELELPVACLPGEHPVERELFTRAYSTKLEVPGEQLPGGIDATQDVRVLTRRKKQTASLRSEESICRLFDLPPRRYIELRRKWNLLRGKDIEDTAKAILSYAVGVAFGRFDIRIARSDCEFVQPHPYEPLPPCSPGMLLGPGRFPAVVGELSFKHDETSGGVGALSVDEYPLPIPWAGVLVEDHESQGVRRADIVHSVGAVLELLWSGQASRIEEEICRALKIEDLREYFRKPGGFFQDHLGAYSKSRRQAPIYWPLSTRSGVYNLWLYYPRLTASTLHTALADFIDPKLKDVKTELEHLRDTNRSPDRFDQLLDLEQELNDMRNEIDRVIKLPYEPNFNDGVLVTACPLWKLFRLPKWQKELKASWEELQRGEYDWSHLALSIRPQQVEKKCKVDRSVAIAHGLEHLCIGEVLARKVKKRRTKADSPEEE